jgi:hypothetical protein
MNAIMSLRLDLLSLSCAIANFAALVASLEVMDFLIIRKASLTADEGAGVIIEITRVPHAIAYFISTCWFLVFLKVACCYWRASNRAAAIAVSARLMSGI